jgi:hypothetical protein
MTLNPKDFKKQLTNCKTAAELNQLWQEKRFLVNRQGFKAKRGLYQFYERLLKKLS